MDKIFVINNLGEKEVFSPTKLYKSARRSGASKELASRVVNTISPLVKNGDTTKNIYKLMKGLLLKLEKPVGIKFSLKESLRKLGPTGYPFEIFMGELFARYGFQTKIEIFVKGICVDYEIDFQAVKDKTMYLSECKYHSDSGSRVDINTILIAYASFVDMDQGEYCSSYKKQGGQVKRLVVTNTKFTNKAIKYASCFGVGLLGWHYPDNSGIEHLIDSSRLYPITILPSMNNYLLDIFFKRGIVFCVDLLKWNEHDLTKQFHIDANIAYKILAESKMLLQ